MEEIEDTARVTPLVVVPGNQLDEVCVEGDTSLGIEDGGVVITVHVSGDNLVLGVTQYAYTSISKFEAKKDPENILPLRGPSAAFLMTALISS